MSMKSNALLVESVAQALSWAISDPSGHPFSNDSVCRGPDSGITLPRTRRRSIEETRRAATVFDSSAIPPITVDKYLMRLNSTFRCSESTFIAALIIVDRLLEYDGGRLPLTERNVHRIFLASLVVAVKYHEDFVYSNSHYGKCGGVHLREVNRLERTILQTLDFDLGIEPEQYKLYEETLQSMRAIRFPAVDQQKPAIPEPPKVTGVAAETSRPTPTGQAEDKDDFKAKGYGNAGQDAETPKAAEVSGAKKTGEEAAAEVSDAKKTGNHLAREREAHDRNCCTPAPPPFGEHAWMMKDFSANDAADVTYIQWVQPPAERAILGLDMAVMVAAAAGETYSRPSKGLSQPV